MTERVALATSRGAWELDDDGPLLVEALDDIGVRAEPAVWNDDRIDWAGFDLVVIRSTWDYVDHHRAFLAWATDVSSETRLENPVDALRWNTDKHYLAELHAAGVPVVPTVYLHADGRDAVSDSWRRLGELVVKPTVSAGSRDTARYGADDHDGARQHIAQLLGDGRDVMVQPYLRAIESQDETGVVMLDGQVSHAFLKSPMLTDGRAAVDGLFAPERIQRHHATPTELELAERTMAAVRRRLGCDALLYARVDMVADDDGRPTVLEVELTEPSFFLAVTPSAAATAASAISERLR